MRLLLDSHVALWWLDDSRSLGKGCRRTIAEADEVFVSVVTPWELGIKRALGKVGYPDGLVVSLGDAGFDLLPISADHAELALELPPHHRDPFDRMLIAQAQRESLVIAAADGTLDQYDIELVEARR